MCLVELKYHIKLFVVFASACFWVTNLLRSDREKIELRQKNGSHKHIVLFILIETSVAILSLSVILPYNSPIDLG